MAYSLLPRNENIDDFRANSYAYATLLAAAQELCPDEWDAVIILPVENHHGNHDATANQAYGWTINDHQHVEAESAARLGQALAQIAHTQEARELLMNGWSAMTGQMDSPRQRQQNRDKLQRMLQDFARFLEQSGGFEIW